MAEETGVGGGLSHLYDYDKRKRLAMKNLGSDIRNFIDSLTSIRDQASFVRTMNRHFSTALINHMEDVMIEAVRRCPYDTGELRESGSVDLIVGGKANRIRVITVHNGDQPEPEVRVHQRVYGRGALTMEAEIYFHKIVKGRDLALWCHEELLDWYPRPVRKSRPASLNKKPRPVSVQTGKKWHATKEGTGPKYLETPFAARASQFRTRAEEAMQNAVREYNSATGQRVRRRRR